MKTIKKLLSLTVLSLFSIINLGPIFNMVLADNPYDEVLDITTNDGGSLETAINGDDIVDGEIGVTLFNKQVDKIVGYVIDFFIVIGIAVAFFGGYKIMTSDKEDSLKEGIRLIVFGIIGIIIMVSAKFIATSLVGNNGIISKEFGNASDINTPNGIQFADSLYNNIMYPFIKIALYFVVGILFFIMAGKVIGFVTATDEKTKEKAGGIIIWCIVGILIVMGSKQIVEAVMGNQDRVLNSGATRINGGEGGMGEEILQFEPIPIIAQIINWVMGFTMLIVLVLIVIQGYKIFTKPDDPKTLEGMKKAIVYILIGVLVIGAAYVISNVLVVNNVEIDLVDS